MSLLRASILGAVDGIITSFTIVASSDAGNESLQTVLVVGISSLISDGLSMGIGEYLSSRAEKATSDALLKTYIDKSLNNKDVYSNEVTKFLATKNIKKNNEIQKLLLNDPLLFYNMNGYSVSLVNPAILGFYCFLSFITFGSIPFIFYLSSGSLIYSILASLFSLFVVGLLEVKKRKSFVAEVLLLGSVCGTVSYFLAVWLDTNFTVN